MQRSFPVELFASRAIAPVASPSSALLHVVQDHQAFQLAAVLGEKEELAHMTLIEFVECPFPSSLCLMLDCEMSVSPS